VSGIGLTTWRLPLGAQEEKEELERELAELEEQLEDAAWRGRVKRQREEVAARELFGQAVRGAIHSQRVAFANTMSHISEFLVRLRLVASACSTCLS
jgi:hypothetical protein